MNCPCASLNPNRFYSALKLIAFNIRLRDLARFQK